MCFSSRCCRTTAVSLRTWRSHWVTTAVWWRCHGDHWRHDCGGGGIAAGPVRWQHRGSTAIIAAETLRHRRCGASLLFRDCTAVVLRRHGGDGGATAVLVRCHDSHGGVAAVMAVPRHPHWDWPNPRRHCGSFEHVQSFLERSFNGPLYTQFGRSYSHLSIDSCWTSHLSVRRIGLAIRWLVLFVCRLELGDCPLCNSVSMTLASSIWIGYCECVGDAPGIDITCLDISKQTRLSLSMLVVLLLAQRWINALCSHLNRFLI